jgi:Protein of unknown function (DUF3237)
MDLEFEFRYRVTLSAPVEIGAGFFGKRLYWEIVSGKVDGARITGQLVGGSDWMIDTSDRFWRPHVRTQIKTADGAFIGMCYDGLVEKSEAFLKAIESNSGTQWDDHYFRIRPVLESGHPTYQWVNTTFFVGEGRIVVPGTVEYRVYRIT